MGQSQVRGGLHVHPEFYAVYLLRLDPKPRSFYVGSLPDPVKRLRQHNGDLKVGGAFRTKRHGFRPWSMVFIVYNFPSKVAALQFEHALQHPYQSRHIIDRLSTKSSSLSLHHRLGNARLLLNSSFFRHLDLKVAIFDETVNKLWHQNKFDVTLCRPVDIKVAIFDEFFKLDKHDADTEFQLVFMAAKKLFLANPHCFLCSKVIDFIPDELAGVNDTQSVVIETVPLVTFCKHCESPFHLLCLANHFLNNDGRTPKVIVPKLAPCPGCKKLLQWSFQTKLSTKLRAYILEDFFNVKIQASQSQAQLLDTEIATEDSDTN